MQLDAYSACPCGSGKKIKFCCCKDLIRDLEKILRTAAGEQFVAASEQVTKSIADHGPRPALLALQAETQVVLQQPKEARQTASRLIEVLPHSGVGLAILAICDVVEGLVEGAVGHLHNAV